MDPDFERKYHAFEDDYWWFRARRDCVLRLVQHSLKIRTDARILEVGCSGGPLLALLQKHGYRNITGIDLSPVAIERCKARGLTDVHVMDATAPALPLNHFDLVIASDVLEHIARPDAALANWQTLLKPAGKLVVFVPAYNFLWSQHDVINHHHRRYTARRLKRDLQTAGFSVARTSYWNAALLPPVAAVRLIARLFPRRQTDQLSPINRPVNALLESWMSVENAILGAGVRLPAGISTMAIARKC
jgi:SAM-dependent methyltransferase